MQFLLLQGTGIPLSLIHIYARKYLLLPFPGHVWQYPHNSVPFLQMQVPPDTADYLLSALRLSLIHILMPIKRDWNQSPNSGPRSISISLGSRSVITEEMSMDASEPMIPAACANCFHSVRLRQIMDAIPLPQIPACKISSRILSIADTAATHQIGRASCRERV